MTYTVALIKPDAVAKHNVGRIINRIERCDRLDIASIRRVRWTPAAASAFYAEHVGRYYFDGLVEFMASGPLYEMVLIGPAAIEDWRCEIGSLTKKYSLRWSYGSRGGHPAHNAVHGSDSDESAARELAELMRRGHPYPV